MRRSFFALWLAATLAGACDAPFAVAQTLPDINATATPMPTGAVLRYSGQLLDVRGGFVFFTTGDGFALDPQCRMVNAATGAPTTRAAVTGMYASASFDPQSGHVVELALSQTPLPQAASYGAIQHFAVALSTPYPDPDLASTPGSGSAPGGPYTGRRVLVQFTVQVPPTTKASGIRKRSNSFASTRFTTASIPSSRPAPSSCTCTRAGRGARWSAGRMGLNVRLTSSSWERTTRRATVTSCTTGPTSSKVLPRRSPALSRRPSIPIPS
jgi:hypothetical protein